MTRMVQLSDEAYNRLNMLKRSGESFSDVVLRVTGGARTLMELRGLRSPAEIAAAERALREIDALDDPEA